MGKKLFPALILLLVWPGSGVGRPRPLPAVKEIHVGPPASHKPAGIFSAAAVETTWFGGTVWNADSSRWEAIPGGTWTFDSGVGSRFEHLAGSCKDPALHSRMEGWTSEDLTMGGIESRFRRLTIADFASGLACVGSDAGLGGNASAWAGLLQSEADSLCWVSGQGYGNDWYVCLEKTFTTTGGDSVDLSYDYTNDTEPNYDYGRVLVDTTGTDSALDLELVRYMGAIPASHATWTLVPGVTLPSGPGSYTLKFCATSDEAYSDEDGDYPTSCGALAVDDIAVTGGGVSDLSDFEAGDDGWTEVHPCKGVGDFADIRDLSDLPVIPGTIGPCNLSDSVLVFFDSNTGGHPPDKDNVALSPWIDLEAAGIAGAFRKFVQADFYADLSYYNYVFVRVGVQWYPDTCSTAGLPGASPLIFSPYAYGLGSLSAPNCDAQGGAPFQVELASILPPDARLVRIALGIVNYCSYYDQYFGNCTHATNASPWFDNVRLGAFEPPPDIQDLIDAAAPGDTVQVPAWTYTGPRNRDLDFHGKSLVLLGEGGAGGTIIDCEGAGRGFLFHSGEDSSSVVQGFTIRNAWASLDSTGAERNGGGAYFGSASPVFRDCIFESCRAYNGGGIFKAGGSPVQLESCRFRADTASEQGGGLYLCGATADLVASTFDSCRARNGGGLFGGGNALLTFDSCAFRSDSTTQDGGGAYLSDAAAVFTQCTFDSSKAHSGGGLYAADSSSATVSACIFSACDAPYGGGGLAAFGDTLHTASCLFTNNTSASRYGGGAFADCPATMDSCSFTLNAGGGFQSGYYYQGPFSPSGESVSVLTGFRYPIVISHCDFENNTDSAVKGQGIDLLDCTFVGNSGGSGGGVYGGFSRITDCRFTGNTAGQGGAIYSYLLDCRRSVLSGNSATVGGGIVVGSGTLYSSNVTDCRITGNRATRGGGAAFFIGAQLVTFEHCTIAGNTASLGGGLFVNESAQPTIRYTIVSGNCADSLGAMLFTEYSSSTADFVCSAVDSSGIAGAGSVAYSGPQVFTNPVFCGPAACENAPTTDGDYHLAANSPCLPGASPCGTLIGALGEGCATVGVPGGKPPIVTRPALAVFPNPFAGSLRIQYAVPGTQAPRLRIYTIAGRLVRELKPESPSGVATWDGRDADGAKLPAGVYFVKMAGAAGGAAQRVVLLR